MRVEGRAVETEESRSVGSKVGQNTETALPIVRRTMDRQLGGSFDLVLRFRVELAVSSTIQYLRTGQQFPQRPIDSLNTFFDFVDTRLSRIFQRSVHNLQFVTDERVHVTNYTELFSKQTASFPFIHIDQKASNSRKDEIIGKQPTRMADQNYV